jgi:phage regulator Rha-like protein
MNAITLIQSQGEARSDSRVLAERLGIQHKNTMELIDHYAGKIQQFGLLPFQTEAVKKPGARGAKHQRHALLNEDQTYFLLALSRNTERVVELKSSLVMAFRLALWRYKKPGAYQHVAHLREQLQLTFGLEELHP